MNRFRNYSNASSSSENVSLLGNNSGATTKNPFVVECNNHVVVVEANNSSCSSSDLYPNSLVSCDSGVSLKESNNYSFGYQQNQIHYPTPESSDENSGLDLFYHQHQNQNQYLAAANNSNNGLLAPNPNSNNNYQSSFPINNNINASSAIPRSYASSVTNTVIPDHHSNNPQQSKQQIIPNASSIPIQKKRNSINKPTFLSNNNNGTGNCIPQTLPLKNPNQQKDQQQQQVAHVNSHKPTPSELNIRDMNQRRRYIGLLANLLDITIASNDRFIAYDTQISRFHSQCVPAISIHRYLERIANYAACSNETLIIAIIYIDRILQSLKCNSSIILNSLNVHRLLITAVLLAGKFNDDCYFNNVHYAKVGGVSHAEMNQLEQEFLYLMDFSLNVTPMEYKRYRWLMENMMILNTTGQHGIITNSPCQIDCLLRLFEYCPSHLINNMH